MLPTLSAILLLAAGLIHSFSLMCRKLPPGRRPRLYPHQVMPQVGIDLLWLVLCLAGLSLAFQLSVWLGAMATALYFVVLPFVFQLPMAKMMGFKSLRDYLESIDS